jgi:hypothetical protein
MKTFACRLGTTSVLCSLAILASAAESKQTVRARAAAPPAAATDAPPAVVEHSNWNVFQAVQLNAVAGDAQAEQGDGTENRLVPATGDQAAQFFQHMKERLADAGQREALRAEQRASIQQQHSEAGRILGLDPATQHKLIELLTDQQMRQLERVYSGPSPKFDSYEQAQAMTKHLDALRELLGDAGLDRFQDYETTQGERRQVGLLSARLGAGNELRPDQETRLIALLREQTVRAAEVMPGPRAMLRRLEGRAMPTREEMQRDSQLSTIALNEEIWRRKQVANRELQKQAAEFLSPAQLAELSKFHAQEQDNLQRWIESARAHMGMDLKIPEHAEAGGPDDVRKPYGGQVQLEIRLTINRGEPKVVTQTVRNGESITFEAADGLIAEATPTLYDDNWLDLKMAYFEQGPAGKRRLQGGGGFGVQTRMPDGTPSRGGGGGTVISGRKGYAIETMITATAL